ncbi:hypothetical protein C4D60_Mb08t23920 [Musa balbisiana]|uniref:Uncharacterized protein n=1 Tax=Musa balbisiana TaxID=52838 RepID=A0A4S8K612_MUSBA|nr:hypothetical protein C4D60_Mb08t23920 [Musa balbisiana]
MPASASRNHPPLSSITICVFRRLQPSSRACGRSLRRSITVELARRRWLSPLSLSLTALITIFLIMNK